MRYLLLLLLIPFPAQANEARCTELGSNCICSEPFNGSITLEDSFYYNPDDTSTKECTVTGTAGQVINHNAADNYTVATSGEAFDNFPNTVSSSITTIMRLTEAGNGGYFGHDFNGETTVRRAFRWYQYYSENISSGGACDNADKIAEIANPTAIGVFESRSDYPYFYGAEDDEWNVPAGFNCCSEGPAPHTPGDPPTMDYQGNQESLLQGTWQRYELVIQNAGSTGDATVMKLYVKDVTNGTDEELIIDTSIPTLNQSAPDYDDWSSTVATTLKPDSEIEQIWAMQFRSAEGDCAGWPGYSHALAAAWSTDTGQRIGAAEEIEGSGESTEPLSSKLPGLSSGGLFTRFTFFIVFAVGLILLGRPMLKRVRH